MSLNCVFLFFFYRGTQGCRRTLVNASYGDTYACTALLLPYSYIEIYQCIESYNNAWAVFVEEASGVYGNDNWKAIPPELTQETVSGVTVLTSLDLPANNPD